MKDRFLGNSVRVRVAFPSSLNTNAISVVVFSSTYAPEAREKKKKNVRAKVPSIRSRHSAERGADLPLSLCPSPNVSSPITHRDTRKQKHRDCQRCRGEAR